MRNVSLKDVFAALLWILSFVVLFVCIVWGVTRLTDAGFKDAAASVQGIGTIVAICVGGAFAYYRLQIFRSFEPHLTITNKVSHRRIGHSYVHIAVTATLLNSSRVKIDLREGYFLLMQIAPTSDEEAERLYQQVFVNHEYDDFQWRTLEVSPRVWQENELIVEPGESHRETCEFIVSAGVESVLVYSYFYNSKASERPEASEGWAATTVHDIHDILDM